MRAVAGHDLAHVAAQVARQAGVMRRVQVPRAHHVTQLEQWCRICLAFIAAVRGDGGPYNLSSSRRHRLSTSCCGAGGDLLCRREAVLLQQQFEAVQPVLVIAGRDVVAGLHCLTGGAVLVQRPAADVAHGRHQREHPRLPERVEDGLVLLRHHRAKSHHAAAVMGTVHGAASR